MLRFGGLQWTSVSERQALAGEARLPLARTCPQRRMRAWELDP